jgi:glycosyltransferase involved in cell wall biosynthesis
MRLIFLSWCYPPMNVPRAVQVARLARATAIRPLEIFCAAEGESAPGDGVTVHRLADHDHVPFTARGRLGRIAAALAVPDTQRRWARAAAREIARRGIAADDLLVTFGQPMSDHLAGLALKRRFGLRWIAHFSDPWSDNPFGARVPLFRLRNRRLERAVVAAADHLLLTSHETVELVMRKYPPAWRTKASVLPHAFDLLHYPPRAAASGPLMLRYLGSLYGERSPLPLLRGIESLARRAPGLAARLRVEFIGDVAPRFPAAAARLALPPGLARFLPAIPYEGALAAMRAADILVQIDAPADTSVFLASKLIDYIGARRPILGVTPAGTARTLILEMGGFVADPGAPDEIAAALERAIALVEKDRDADWGDEAVRRRFDSATVAAAFERVVERVRGGA